MSESDESLLGSPLREMRKYNQLINYWLCGNSNWWCET